MEAYRIGKKLIQAGSVNRDPEVARLVPIEFPPPILPVQKSIGGFEVPRIWIEPPDSRPILQDPESSLKVDYESRETSASEHSGRRPKGIETVVFWIVQVERFRSERPQFLAGGLKQLKSALPPETARVLFIVLVPSERIVFSIVAIQAIVCADPKLLFRIFMNVVNGVSAEGVISVRIILVLSKCVAVIAQQADRPSGIPEPEVAITIAVKRPNVPHPHIRFEMGEGNLSGELQAETAENEYEQKEGCFHTVYFRRK